MKSKYAILSATLLGALLIALVFFSGSRDLFFDFRDSSANSSTAASRFDPESLAAREIDWGMKLIPPDISNDDLDRLRAMGITLLQGEWGMSELGAQEMLALLDRVEERDMQFIINFSDYSAWGHNSPTPPSNEAPEWNRERVLEYLREIYHHSAIHSYDISNEAGENLPNSDSFRVSIEQLREARETIRLIDPVRPILVRMHYWDEEDGDFGWDNPFADNIADIVMLNLYSNYTNNGQTTLLPDMVEDSASELVQKIRDIDDDVEIWISLGAFGDNDIFLKPTTQDLERDISEALDVPEARAILFFGWGPLTSGENTFTLSKDTGEQLEVIEKYIDATASVSKENPQ